MTKIFYFFGILAVSSAQFQHPAYLDIPGVTPPPWQGPIADHINGILPQDTPEVAAAKAALKEAYAQVLAVLPVLPPEERYSEIPSHHVPVHHVPVHNVPIVPHHIHHHDYHSFVPQVPTVHLPQVLAEEIPRSPIGEVPEVHAARVAHLKAYQDRVAILPRISETVTEQVYHHVQPAVPYHNNPYLSNLNLNPLQDTPEVAKAKAEHAAAVAALG